MLSLFLGNVYDGDDDDNDDDKGCSVQKYKISASQSDKPLNGAGSPRCRPGSVQ